MGYLLKLLCNHSATLSPKNLENASNIKGWCMNVVAHKNVYAPEISVGKAMTELQQILNILMGCLHISVTLIVKQQSTAVVATLI